MLETLTHIGRYNIESELGRGSMGVVFKGFDPLVERTVAIKTIPLDVEGPELAHRLQLEAKSVGQLEHPNIVTLYDAGEANGLFYLAMQFIQGETLRDRINRQRWFSLEEIQEFLRQIGSALDYAHRRGVIHRDIKPANIMITPDGVVKLTDFGIAKHAGGTTTAGMIMGTPSYMSPEQALGKPLDGRSDIFSLGSILYELFTGEQAFPGSNATTVMYRIVHEPPSPISALRPGFDPALEVIVLKALAKQPEQRYPTCAELAASVDRYLQAGLSVGQVSATGLPSVSPTGAAATASQPTVGMQAPGRLTLIWLAGGLLALFLLAGIWGIARLPHTEEKAPSSASTSATRTTTSSELRDMTSSPAQSGTPPASAASEGESLASPPPSPQIRPAPSSAPKQAAKTSAKARAQRGSIASPRSTEGPPTALPRPAAISPAEQTQPETFKGHMLKGDMAFQESRYEDALAAYSKAHQMEPGNREARRKIAVVLTLLGRAEEAQRYK